MILTVVVAATLYDAEIEALLAVGATTPAVALTKTRLPAASYL